MTGVPVLLEVDSQVHVVGRIAFCHVSVSFLNWVKIFLWMSMQGFSLPNQTGNCNWLPPWQNLQNYDSHLKSKFGSSEGYPIATLVYGLNWFVVWTRHNLSNILPLPNSKIRTTLDYLKREKILPSRLRMAGFGCCLSSVHPIHKIETKIRAPSAKILRWKMTMSYSLSKIIEEGFRPNLTGRQHGDGSLAFIGQCLDSIRYELEKPVKCFGCEPQIWPRFNTGAAYITRTVNPVWDKLKLGHFRCAWQIWILSIQAYGASDKRIAIFKKRFRHTLESLTAHCHVVEFVVLCLVKLTPYPYSSPHISEL